MRTTYSWRGKENQEQESSDSILDATELPILRVHSRNIELIFKQIRRCRVLKCANLDYRTLNRSRQVATRFRLKLKWETVSNYSQLPKTVLDTFLPTAHEGWEKLPVWVTQLPVGCSEAEISASSTICVSQQWKIFISLLSHGELKNLLRLFFWKL